MEQSGQRRKEGKQRPTAPPALRVGDWGRERIVIPEEERTRSLNLFSRLPEFLIQSLLRFGRLKDLRGMR